MYSCELDKSLSHKVTRDTLLLGDGSWNKNVPVDSKMFASKILIVSLAKKVGFANLEFINPMKGEGSLRQQITVVQ